jgi:hypothetical protein
LAIRAFSSFRKDKRDCATSASNSSQCALGSMRASTITPIHRAISFEARIRSRMARRHAVNSAVRAPCVRALRLPFGAPAPFRFPLTGPAIKLFAETREGVPPLPAFRRRMIGLAMWSQFSMHTFYHGFGGVR